MTWALVVLPLAAVLWLALAVAAFWRRKRIPPLPTLAQIEQDIAKAEALAKAEGRTLRVDRSERMAPSHRRIKF